MAFIFRRVFYAKVGMADPIVNHFRETDKSMQEYGFNPKSRILTDYDSGRSDRVVVEWELDNSGDLRGSLSSMMSKPGAPEALNAWMAALNDLIHYSEAETWQIR